MGLFHKKNKVPELPPANLPPSIQEPPKKENSELPSVPKNLGAGLNREIVKSAVNDKNEEMHESIIVSKSESLPSEDKLIPSVPKEPVKEIKVAPVKNDNPLFVRIDKFQNAKTDLKEIDKKIKTIESSLKKFNEIKMREDTEISELNRELGFVKEKISQVDMNIFEKI